MFEKFIISLYFHESKKSERFFDIWWQVTYSIEYVILCYLIIIYHLIVGCFNINYNPYIYFTFVVLLAIVNCLFGNRIKNKYEPIIKSKSEKTKPYNKLLIYTFYVLGLIILIFSFNFI